MKEDKLSDLICPGVSTLYVGNRAHCHGAIKLATSVPVTRAEHDPLEILEGIVQCEKCGSEYPIICGVLLLVGAIKTYIANYYSEIMSIAASNGVSMSMITYLRRTGSDLQDTGYRYSFWRNELGMNLYIAAHYDSLIDFLEPGHPLEGLVRDYCQRDFYTQMLELVDSELGRNKASLDVGCNVGGMLWRLADACHFVYGVDFSFRAALTARRILLGQPQPFTSYRLYREGLASEERALINTQKRNVELLVASGTNLPFKDGVFDFVSCTNVLDVVDQPTRLVDNVLRVAKAGAGVLVTDPYIWSTDHASIESWLISESGMDSGRALRTYLQTTSDIVGEADPVLWILRAYDRYFTLWLNDCILVRTRGSGRQ